MKKLSFALPLPLLFFSNIAFAEPTPTPSVAPAAPVYEPQSASPAPAPAPAPAADEPVTLVNSRGFIHHHGWYVAPTFGSTTLDGNYSSLVGLRGAWLINRQFGIGLAGSAFGWGRGRIDWPEQNSRADGGYGGVLLQYIIASDALVHGTVDATMGGGALCYDGPGSQHHCDDRTTFYVFEPMANVELNVCSFMRVAVGGGYRFAAVDEQTTPYKPELSGFVARTSIKFGQF